MPIQQKEYIEEIIKQAGIEIIDKWNHNIFSHSVSFKTNILTSYIPNKTPDATKREIKNYIDILNQFVN